MNRPNFNPKYNNIIRSVTEAERKEAAKVDGFQRPNHPDFMLSSELKNIAFTGVRQNEISREWEFWIGGEIKKRVHEKDATPAELTKIHVELFQLRTS